MEEIFDKEFYLATLRTARGVGMSIIPKWKCAMLMGIVYVFGNNENFVMSKKFLAGVEFIKETYHIGGGETPTDLEFNRMLREYVEAFEAIKSKEEPLFKECKELIKDRYNFDLWF